MKSLLLFFLVFASSFAQADWRQNSVLVTENSEMQKHIDNAMYEIFNSSFKRNLCQIYGTSLSIMYSLGTSADAAVQIAQLCPKDQQAPLPKHFRKQYYISFEPVPGLESWTDLSNRTFIFVDKSLNKDKLKSILLHELAISTDSKSGLMFSTYLMMSQRGKSVGNFQVITLNDNDPELQRLSPAFNIAAWSPIAITFATMRAFNLEAAFLEQRFESDKHGQCVKIFKETFEIVRKIPQAPAAEDISKITAMLISAIDERSNAKSPAEIEQDIEHILQEDLKLKDINGDNVSFCQFMARPLLTSRTAYNLFANGPRPRLTGGSGGQSRDLNDERDRLSQSGLFQVKEFDAVQETLRKMQKSVQAPKIEQQSQGREKKTK